MLEGLLGKKEAQSDFEYFTVFDTKTGSYDVPFIAMNDKDMIRNVLNTFREPKEQMSNRLFLNAEDFQIFRVGCFCKSTGTLTSCKPTHVVNLHDLKSMVDVVRPGLPAVKEAGALLPT